MSYTGFQDITPGMTRCRTAEEVLSHADAIETTTGRTVKHKAIAEARTAAERLDQLRIAGEQITHETSADLEKAAEALATGKAKPTDVARLANAAALAEAATEQRRALVARAALPTNQAAVRRAIVMPDDVWLAPLVARMAELLEQAHALAEQVTREQPTIRGERTIGHHLAPNRSQLDTDMELRHAWERFAAVLADVDRVHYLADGLRNMGMIASVPGRDAAEDYRWFHVDKLQGDPAQVREFFLTNRHDGKPGIYTAADLDGTGAPTVQERGIEDAATLRAQATALASI